MRPYSFLALFLLSFLFLSSCAKKNLSTNNNLSRQEVETVSKSPSKTNSKGQDVNTNQPKTVADCIDQNKRRMELGCPDEIKYVCGCNQKTYRNACEADREGVSSYVPGKCFPVADF